MPRRPKLKQPVELDESGLNLADEAYRHILDQILRGSLPMGGEINRREIAAELGMSLLPVGEALQRLELEMLVESGRRVGTRVRIPTPQDIRGFCTVREALETQAGRLFNERARTAERNQLKELAAQLDGLYEESSEDPDRFPAERLHDLRVLHKNFHLKIAEGANCPYLHRQIETTLNLVFSSFYDHLFGDRRLPFQWHQMLAKAICDGSMEAAELASRRHVQHHLEEIMYRLEAYFTLDRDRLAGAMANKMS